MIKNQEQQEEEEKVRTTKHVYYVNTKAYAPQPMRETCVNGFCLSLLPKQSSIQYISIYLSCL